MRAREQSRSYAVSSVVQTIVGLALAIIFVVGLHLGGRGVLLSQLVAELALCVFLFPATLRGMRLLVFSRRDASDLLTYGLALVPAALLSFRDPPVRPLLPEVLRLGQRGGHLRARVPLR